jgi:hypothetical protein
VVYFIAAGDTAVKIGTTTNLQRRMVDLGTSSHVPLQVLAYVPGGPVLEAFFHSKLRKHRTRGEWFARTEEINALIEELAALSK